MSVELPMRDARNFLDLISPTSFTSNYVELDQNRANVYHAQGLWNTHQECVEQYLGDQPWYRYLEKGYCKLGDDACTLLTKWSNLKKLTLGTNAEPKWETILAQRDANIWWKLGGTWRGLN